VEDLTNIIDMEVIRRADLRICADALGGSGKDYWKVIAKRYGLKVYAQVNTRKKFAKAHAVFAKHPEARGALTWKADGEYVLCTEHPLVRRYLMESVEGLFEALTVTLATVGILAKLKFRHRYPRLSLISYLLMGWLVIVAAPEVADAIGSDGMTWLVAGGLSYTVGAGFYMAKKVTYSHAIWHLFVLIGGVCHFLAVVWYVLPESLPGVAGA